MATEEAATVGAAPRDAGGAESEPSARQPRRGEVRLFGHWCKGCGLCIAFCPRQVFAAGADGRPLAVYPERCTACMFCAEHCPDFAITVRPFTPTDGRQVP